MKIRFQKNWAHNSYDMWLVWEQRHHYDIKITVTESKELIDEDARMYKTREPDARIKMDIFQRILPALLDGLAEAGFMAVRPADVAHLESIKYHLEDMRKLVFEEPKIVNKPKQQGEFYP